MNNKSLLVIACIGTACAPFSPTEGTWIVDGFEVTENECNLETTDQTGETMVLASSDDGFTMSFDDGEPYGCTLSGQDFECEEPSSAVGESDPDSEFALEVATTGLFTSETDLEISTRVTLKCLVEDCTEYEEYFGATFPCASASQIEMSFSE